MSELRQKFEELPDIKGIIYGSDFGFNESLNQYYHPDHTNHRLNYAFIMGAWYAFQLQQAKIDLIEKEIVETQEFLNKQNHIKQTKIDAVIATIETTSSNSSTALSDIEFLKNKIKELLK